MNRLPEKGRIPVVTVMLVLLNLAAFILISGSESPEALMRKYGSALKILSRGEIF
ncbi:MAG: hypothetical protein QXG38_02190 [Candidatus Hadarchaeales archaeon]